ncbi:MAG: 2-aminoethylphosphonate--pyruvate transaminase [Schleiferilactobacillus harbinensis]|nr:2-aminoethylphosphonate--pyruvate transaminase [Schleiferilactobacillus harbinensis]MCI1782661.1 2-aminoethylphosphonate--pyruvate transaminase [Schleiferilactobacillus harbinensis]MCI1849605.1 2-aminoethylphosphonate--pyruvate transaminase [Schleiferilactobacillus harbinensis]
MLIDHGTWDDEYKALTETVRQELLSVAQAPAADYTTILMQGSGTFAVEAALGTAVPQDGVLLIAMNGAYGRRMGQIADYYNIVHVDLEFAEDEPVTREKVLTVLDDHPEVTHFATVHCETTTGILNPIDAIIPAVHARGVVTIVDAMSSFGGVPIDTAALGLDYLISSSNKCIQGVPGFGFIIANRTALARTEGNARSLSLDLYDQNQSFDQQHGKWRFTSPTHVLYAFHQALQELAAEGGVPARFARYTRSEQQLRQGMRALGYAPVIAEADQSPIITSFKYPSAAFDFHAFYAYLKDRGFIIYPGKVSTIDSFRIGNIGEVYTGDIQQLLRWIKTYSTVRVQSGRKID